MPLALLGLHAVLAVAAPWLQRVLGRRVLLACALAPAATVAWAASQAGAVVQGRPVHSAVSWVPRLGLSADLRLDGFGLLMVALVSGVGVLVFGYAYGYFDKPRGDLGKFAGSLTGFAGAMLGLVLADNLILVFVFWELTSVTSFLLIGTEDRRLGARQAAVQALLTTGAGGLAMLGGFVLLGQSAGTYAMSELLVSPPSGRLVEVGLLLVLIGAFTKSAQVPFHAWLPGAMAAPTPVSAYLHSATMVKAGVYLVARLAPAFALASVWRPAVLAVGLATMAVGGYRALRQHDLKLLLAYGTVSQLGFLMVLLGVGTPDMTFAGCVLLLAHGMFKAALFMVAGVIDKQTGTRDIRKLDGVYRQLPWTAAAAAVAAASMAGLPPLVGFVAKEAAYEGLLHGDLGPSGPVVLVGIVAGSVLTVAYSARFWHGAFWRRPVALQPRAVVDRPSRALAGPVLALAVMSVLAGVLPILVDGLVNAATTSLEPGFEPVRLKLWHGFNVALGLSVLTVGLGAALFAARRPVERLQARVRGIPSSQQGYDVSLNSLVRGAARMTGVVQNGSLPVYLAVILLTLLVLPGGALIRAVGMPSAPPPSSPLQTAIAALVIVAAVGCVAVGRRFSAVLLLGAVGFGVAGLFVVQGAPDLALTQFLVETLSLVIFVLVLRHLPDRFEEHHRSLPRAARALIAGGVGTFVGLFALAAGSARTAPPVSEEFVRRALPEAEGRNVVNVILVDFRAMDTLGEIVVLLTAALGIATLVTATRLGAAHGSRRESLSEEEAT